MAEDHCFEQEGEVLRGYLEHPPLPEIQGIADDYLRSFWGVPEHGEGVVLLDPLSSLELEARVLVPRDEDNQIVSIRENLLKLPLHSELGYLLNRGSEQHLEGVEGVSSAVEQPKTSRELSE